MRALINNKYNTAFFMFIIVVILMWISWNPYNIYKEKLLYERLTKEKMYIVQSEELIKDKEFESALEALDYAEKLDARNLYVNLNRARIYWETEQHSKALIYYNKVLQLNNKLLEPYIKISSFYLQNNMYEESYKYIGIAQKIFPDNSEVREIFNKAKDKIKKVENNNVK